MRDETLPATVARSFKLLLLCATFCMVCLTMAEVASLRQIGTGSKAHVQAFEPAKQLAASFDHEIMSARLSFNAALASSKAEDLANAWGQYRLAELRFRDLNTLIAQYPQLDAIRPATAQLGKDLSAFAAAMSGGTGSEQGAHEAQIKEWTTQAGVIEKDTDDLETLIFRASEVNTNAIGQSISDSQMSGYLLLSIGFFIYYLLTRMLRRKMVAALDNKPTDGISILSPIRSATAPAANFGAH